MAMSAQDITYKWLKNRIGALPRHEGTFLTEAEVASESGVSRTPAREALLRLEVEGLVQILPKKGAFVPPLSDAEVEATMQARMLVERWAATKVAGEKESIEAPLDELLVEQLQLIDQDDSGAFIDADRRFHRVIIQRAGNSVLDDFYESMRDRQVRMGLRAVTGRRDRGQSVIDEHKAIRDAIFDGSVERADDAVRTHLTNTLEVLMRPAALLGEDAFSLRRRRLM